MSFKTDNLRILSRKSLVSSDVLIQEIPISDKASQIVVKTREDISNCLHGKDDRLVVVVGPCSVHDLDAAVEYGEKLLEQSLRFKDDLVIIMRVYFEKPRTTVGWKGFINDPYLDNSFNINQGLTNARTLLLKLSDMGMPCGTEFLDVISPQYISDLISWAAIGARTTESQLHRELASGLSSPVGFKNATDGNVQIAIDAIRAANASHHFLSVTKNGTTAIYETAGNQDTHVILRGGATGPNYDETSINDSNAKLEMFNLPAKLMVDCSHGNSNKNYKNQSLVIESLTNQLSNGDKGIFGVMIESNLKEGKQNIDEKPLEYGKSITDACVSWEMTIPMLASLADAVQKRRLIV